MKWAAESAASYAAASQAGGKAGAQADEMAKSLEKLAQSGMLADAPPELQKLLGDQQALAGDKVQLPTDPASMRRLSELLSQHLDNRNRRFGNLAALGKEFGRFDPSEFPLFCPNPGADSNGEPGAGGINRGRGDAPLTWGRESLPFDRFKAMALPPGFVRSPDDWAPLAELPGAPKESPQLSMPLPAQQYLGTAGQAAWRRTLAPRHHSAVRKYLDNSPSTQRK